MKTYPLNNILQFLALMIFLFNTAPLLYASDNTFLENNYWDSGKAEFQVYNAKISRYGFPRNGLAKIIVVKEPFDTDKMVKTGRTSKASEVIKMNYIQTVPTGVYDYFQMASFFFDRNTGNLLKYTMSSQDGCGNTFMQYLYKNNKSSFLFHSYFDHEGDIQIDLKSKAPLVFYDALPLVLRFRLQEKKAYNLKIIPQLINNRFTEPVIVDAEITNRPIDSVQIGTTQFRNIYTSTVEIAGKRDLFYFESVFPYRLVKWVKNNNDELILKDSNFFHYWKYNKPGDRIDKIDIHEPWNEILATYVKDGMVRYGDLKKNSADMKKIDAYLEALGKADVMNFSREDLLAFWINAYNAFIVELILNHYPVKSIKDIKNPWKQKSWLAAGERLSLDDIEHKKLRKDLNEPRIHFAIVCASKGCPELYNKAFRGKDIHTALNKVALSFFASRKNFFIEQSGSVTNLYLSRIFKWSGSDFGTTEKERISFILPFLNKDDVDRINNARKVKIKYLDYDWSLNVKRD